MAIVFQLAGGGASQDRIEVLGLGTGLGYGHWLFGLSLYYKRPIIIVWSYAWRSTY